MQLNTVIFDMDGLLIDSEPLWNKAAQEVLLQYGVKLSAQQYISTTGLRTKDFIDWWFSHFELPVEKMVIAHNDIVTRVTELIIQKGKPMPGIEHIFNFFIKQGFKIGLATSSAPVVIDAVVELLGIKKHLQAITSGDLLPYGKPHPQVYLNCAGELNSNPLQCLCFEDSFNGMIAAKAARMKCIVVPAVHESKDLKWNAADLRIGSLSNFNELLLHSL